jgi:hypothetical protein
VSRSERSTTVPSGWRALAVGSIRLRAHWRADWPDSGSPGTGVRALAANGFRLHWGPGRHGPGHNIFTYYNDPDGNQVELVTQLDVVYDESKGYFEPRPWHEDFPQYPKTWEIDLAVANKWARCTCRLSTTEPGRSRKGSIHDRTDGHRLRAVRGR